MLLLNFLSVKQQVFFYLTSHKQKKFYLFFIKKFIFEILFVLTFQIVVSRILTVMQIANYYQLSIVLPFIIRNLILSISLDLLIFLLV